MPCLSGLADGDGRRRSVVGTIQPLDRDLTHLYGSDHLRFLIGSEYTGYGLALGVIVDHRRVADAKAVARFHCDHYGSCARCHAVGGNRRDAGAVVWERTTARIGGWDP